MRILLINVLALSHLVACAAPTVPVSNGVSRQDYTRAIQDAVVVADLDRKDDLRRCVKNWRGASSVRNALLQEVLSSRNELKRDSILLEIGGSTWPRYDYVYVENNKLRSSFDNASQLDIGGTTLENRLNEILTSGLPSLTGRAYSTADDAGCYFLSVKSGRAMKTVAVYGTLDDTKADSTNVDSLIRDLLAAVGRRR